MYYVLLGISTFILLSFIVPFFLFGAGFSPTASKRVDRMVKAAQIKDGEKAADLGSGDGRLVIRLAQAGAFATGYEINPILAWWSRWRIKRNFMEKRATIVEKNFWKEDFSQFSIVTVFGIKYIMPRLEKKLMKELKPGSRVISNYFQFPNWKPEKIDNGVCLYVKR